MGKTKILHKRRVSSSKPLKSQRKKNDKPFEISLRKDMGIRPFHAVETLTDIRLIGIAIMQCLIENDPAGVIELIEGHLEAMNVSSFAEEAGVPRSTIYKFMKNKNLTVKTLAKIVHAAHQAKSEE